VDIEKASWNANEQGKIISLLYKIIRQAAQLTPVSSLSRQESVQERAGLRFMM
jgi:hypothetical protein